MQCYENRHKILLHWWKRFGPYVYSCGWSQISMFSSKSINSIHAIAYMDSQEHAIIFHLNRYNKLFFEASCKVPIEWNLFKVLLKGHTEKFKCHRNNDLLWKELRTPFESERSFEQIKIQKLHFKTQELHE